jgi:hypothetical protein
MRPRAAEAAARISLLRSSCWPRSEGTTACNASRQTCWKVAMRKSVVVGAPAVSSTR